MGLAGGRVVKVAELPHGRHMWSRWLDSHLLVRVPDLPACFLTFLHSLCLCLVDFKK